jgi:capsular polysaccharide transport system permease protein
MWARNAQLDEITNSRPTAPGKIGWGSASNELVRTAGRLAKTGVARAPILIRKGVDGLGPHIRGGGGAGRSFVALVVLPTLIYLFYAAFWQSPYYVAETRLTVRNSQTLAKLSTENVQSSTSQQKGKLANSESLTQNSYIVLNYIKSLSLIGGLGGEKYLEQRYGTHDIDYFSRININERIEDGLKYWLNHLFASVDIMSGILTMKVTAYRPQDAVAISNDVVRLSEALINDITLRNRKDRLARDEREVAYAADKLAQARAALTQFRQQNLLIDPSSRAKEIGDVIGKLTLDKIKIENSLSTLTGVIDPYSPTLRVHRAKLSAIDKQIEHLRKSLTNPNDELAVTSQIAAYERLSHDEQFALMLYTTAQNAYQQARKALESQQLYLAVIVPPIPPQRSSGPRVLGGAVLVFASLGIVWSIIALLIASINDHIA